MNEQQALKKSAEQRITQANNRLRDIKRDFGEMNIPKMIKNIQDEVNSNSILLQEKIPKQLTEYKEKVDSLNKLVTEPLDGELLTRQVTQLERDIQEIETKHRPKLTSGEEQSVGLVRQQASLMANRKAKAQDELASLKEQKGKLDEELEAKETEFKSYQGSKILKGDEFKAYANSLRVKSTQYKALKAELQELKGELGILQRTEVLLTQRAEALNASITAIEKQKGIDGYRDLKENLVAMSEQRQEVDEAKGKTLEELSKVVQEFVANIRNKRNKLAPQILELRNTRQKSQAVEQEYQQKKEIYETAQHELEDDLGKLQSEVDSYNHECHVSESMYHRLNSQILIAEVEQRRITDEKEFKTGVRKMNDQYKTYAERLEAQIQQLETLSKDLRERKKDIEENHESNLQQMKWFRDLHKLLECKINILKREAAGHTSNSLAGVDMNQLGVDRLVL
eukprot:NODE_1189_length_2080_cov_32.364333_g1001_i0.p1 GENE.NODE_1189_length_2080_cov_32.364333_g1001_i0~~NODE_1189_length_2080_cov_32.364333_g1001_i0.p1  ORF type:complete len:454 (+),score=122.11 NODE_1189_length_2080_cov_32.364333_g1001_i0:569-1930(+)